MIISKKRPQPPTPGILRTLVWAWDRGMARVLCTIFCRQTKQTAIGDEGTKPCRSRFHRSTGTRPGRRKRGSRSVGVSREGGTRSNTSSTA